MINGISRGENNRGVIQYVQSFFTQFFPGYAIYLDKWSEIKFNLVFLSQRMIWRFPVPWIGLGYKNALYFLQTVLPYFFTLAAIALAAIIEGLSRERKDIEYYKTAERALRWTLIEIVCTSDKAIVKHKKIAATNAKRL